MDINKYINKSIEAIKTLKKCENNINSATEALQECIITGGCIYTCGNGGSAAQAMHFSEELMGRYKKDRDPICSFCLNSDPTLLSCIANDYSFNSVFSRQVDALRPEDVLIVFSTSGMSENICRALRVARNKNMKTIGILGKGGGYAQKLCSESIVVSSSETNFIQEAHQVLIHIIIESIENQIGRDKKGYRKYI